ASDGGSTGETKFIDIAITETKPVSGGGGEDPDPTPGPDVPDDPVGTGDGLDEGTISFVGTTAKPTIKGLNFIGNIKFFDNGNNEKHGFQAGDANAALELNLTKAATIEVTTCCYGAGNVTSTSGTVTSVDGTEKDGEKVAKVYTIAEATGKTTLKLGAGAYVHSIKVTYDKEDPNAGKSQDVQVTVDSSQDGEDLLAPTDKVILQNTSDADESVKVTNGSSATLKVGNTYKAVVKDSAGQEKTGLTITINDIRNFKMNSETNNVTIKVRKSGSDVPIQKVTYDFTKHTAQTDPLTVGETLDNGIYVAEPTGTGKPGLLNSVGKDAHLKFRQGSIIWIPLDDDTTKVTYTQVSRQNKTDRPTYIGKGGANSGYSVIMDKNGDSVTLDDLDGLTELKDGKRYLPVESGGNVEIYSITVKEFNPINTVTVSGTVTMPEAAKSQVTEIRFKSLSDNVKGDIVKAPIQPDGTYTAELKRVAGNTKYAAVVGANAWKIDDAGGADQFTLTGNGATATQNFTVVEKVGTKVTGKVTGIPAEAIKGGDLGVALISENEALDPVALTLTKAGDDYTYAEVLLEQGMTYTVKLTNADDYEVTGEFKIPEEASYTLDLAAALKPLMDVSGKFITSDRKTATVTKITFTNMEDAKYTYTFDVTGNTYTANLRAAEYVTSVEGATGYTVFDHVSVKDAAVENDVYLQCAVDTSAVEYKETVTVGAGKDFEKIADAVAYISRMTRTDDQRVTIVLDKNATYREQLIIDIPNITIRGNGSKITWYYGVGFSYYSAKPSTDGKNGAYYDEAYAVDKYEKTKIAQNPGHWGATVNLFAGAKGFSAENLTFENSLNYYVTDEELADGAGANEGTGVTARAKGIDVFAKAAKERGCVLYIQADNTAYKDCNFLSEQDTIFTGDAQEHSYFVSCTIEGNTDYICGDGNAVFDKCMLSMYGYSDQDAKGSYIVANKKVATHGYLFMDSQIVSVSGRKPVYDTYLGRAWAAGKLYFINTQVEDETAIIAAGYANMNENVVDAHYYEYNTHLPDGTALNVKRADGVTIMTKAEADAVVMSDFFDGWKPPYYVEPSSEDPGTGDGWDKVAAPVIDSAEYVSGDGEDESKVVVKVTADVSSAGGESLEVVLINADGTTAQTQTTVYKGTEHAFEFTVTEYKGPYTVKAILKRAGKTAKESEPVNVAEADNSFSESAWKKVAKPVINDAVYTSGDGDDKRLTITVTADVSDKGGTSLDVTVKKEGSDKGQTQTSKTKQTKHTFVFAVSGPGKYEVTATLKRKGMADKTTTKIVTIKANGQTVISNGREGLYVELLDDDAKYVYTGSAIKPAIAVWNGDELLKEGTDYTVKYSNNVKASVGNSTNRKEPTITVTGKGRFTGKAVKTFNIYQKELTLDFDPEEDVVIGGLSKEAANTLVVAKNVKLNPILVYKGVILKAGDNKDFKLIANGITNNKPQAGDSGKKITIEGVNNYTGTLELELDVKDVQKLTSVKVDKNKVKNYAYDGDKKEVASVIEVKAGTAVLDKEDYIIVPKGDLTSAGTQKFTVIGVGIYAGSKTSSFKINPRKIDQVVPVNELADANGKVTCTFNSAGVTFNDAITITDELPNGELAELVLGKDYKVSYSGNKKVGKTAKYTISFLGNYKGSKTKDKNYTFEIEAANLETLEAEGELYAIAANKTYTKATQYKSAPYVLVNGVALKKSDYTVKYYVGDSVMSNSNKVELAAGATSATVRVEITGKKNYTGTVNTTFEVESGTTDLSKLAKITLKESNSDKKQSKKEYTGEAVYPDRMEIKIGTAVTTLTHDPATDSWLTTDGTPTQDFNITVVNNIAKGKATVIVNGDGSKNVGSKTATFSVVAHNFANVPADFWPDFSSVLLNWPGLWSVR
ncbi:MAG: hypothetical protein K2O32_05530, partial [Acetatifactor sp.]|nr:hypothetical protein [Acetatifactor sp.]